MRIQRPVIRAIVVNTSRHHRRVRGVDVADKRPRAIGEGALYFQVSGVVCSKTPDMVEALYNVNRVSFVLDICILIAVLLLK
jgi:hypothetical protein